MAKKGKEQIVLNISGKEQEVNNVIQQYLQANGFQQLNENGIIWYQAKTPMVYKCLEYYIGNGQLTLLTFTGNQRRCFYPSTDLYGMSYANDIKDLVNIINNIITGISNQPQYNNNIGVNTANGVNNQYGNVADTGSYFVGQVNKKNETMAIIALVISILSLLLSCCGIIPALIITIIGYVLAANGLKSSKRVAAIVAIVLNSLAIVINIVVILLTAFGYLG